MQRSQADLFAAALETPLFRGLPAAFVEHAIAQGYVERFAPGTPVLRSGDARRARCWAQPACSLRTRML